MPQHLANIRQRRPLAQHVDGKRMTKLMCSCGTEFDTGAPDRTRDDLAYIAVRTQTIKGGARAQKHPAADRFRAPVLKIDCNSLSNVMRQGQRSFHSPLAMHTPTAFAPVDIP